MLREKIKADALSARKAKLPASGVLTTLLGEMSTKEKTFNPARNLTEDEVVAMVRKFLKNIDESVAALDRLPDDRRGGEQAKLIAEKTALEGYLPQQLSASEIESIVREEVAAGSNLGGIMAALKGRYAGRYDGKMASEIAKRLVAES